MVQQSAVALKGIKILLGLLLAGPLLIVLVGFLRRLGSRPPQPQPGSTSPAPTDSSAQPSSATSTLWIRYLTLIGFTTVFVGTAYFGELPFFLFMLVVVCIGLWEFWRLLQACDVKAYRAFGWVAGVGLVSAAYFWGAQPMSVALMGIVTTLLPVALLMGSRQGLPIRLGATLLAIIYIAFLGSTLVLLRGEPAGLLKIIFFYAVIQFADVFALLGGSTLGGPKMTPKISPTKTWSGTVVGFAAAAGGAMLFRFTVPELSLIRVIVTALALAFAGLMGDLVASAFKRAGGLKDFSNLLPGHGGILDRFDSILLSAPLAWLLLTQV